MKFFRVLLAPQPCCAPRHLAAFFGAFLLLADSGFAASTVTLVAGGGTETNLTKALKPTEARLRQPFGTEFDRHGNIYFVEMTGHTVRKLDPEGNLRVIAGTGAKGFGGDDGPALQATFDGIHNLAVAPNGDIYLADTWNNRARKLEAKTGKVTTVAGTGEKGFSGDGGPAKLAKFGAVYCVSLDPSGEQLYIADLDNRRVRSVDLKSGQVRTIAGNGQRGVPVDGQPAVESPLVDPRAVLIDREGQVYVLERSGHALRLVDRKGLIRTVAGTGLRGSGGDGGFAREAQLNGPKHLCLDRDGSILIADTENHVIRRYDPADGKMTRLVGTGRKGAQGLNRPPLEIDLSQPHGISLHPDGSLYISDSSNHRVLRLGRE